MPPCLYHPHEISLQGHAESVARLRALLENAFPATRRVASIHHNALALAATEIDGRVVRLDLAGTNSRWELPAHPDPALLSQLSASADLALLQGTSSPGSLKLMVVDADTPMEAMVGAVALVGDVPPERTPPGGIPFFHPSEIEELAAYLEDLVQTNVREKPLLGLVAGNRSPAAATELASFLDGLVAAAFVVSDVASSALLPSWVRPMNRSLGGVGFVGDLIEAASALPGSGLLVISGREGEMPTRQAVEHLIEARDPLADATAFRGLEDSLPRNGAVLWEAKGLMRLWSFLGTGLRCPQRILNQCRTNLVEPL